MKNKLLFALIAGLLAMIVGCASPIETVPAPAKLTLTVTKTVFGPKVTVTGNSRSARAAGGSGVTFDTSTPNVVKDGTPPTDTSIAVLATDTGLVTPILPGVVTVVVTNTASGLSGSIDVALSPIDIANTASGRLSNANGAVATVWRMVSWKGYGTVDGVIYGSADGQRFGLAMVANVAASNVIQPTVGGVVQDSTLIAKGKYNAGYFYMTDVNETNGVMNRFIPVNSSSGYGAWSVVNGQLTLTGGGDASAFTYTIDAESHLVATSSNPNPNGGAWAWVQTFEVLPSSATEIMWY